MKKIVFGFISIVLIHVAISSPTASASVRSTVFSDLAFHNRFYESVYSMYLKEVIDGSYDEQGRLFIEPTKAVTRADAAYMLYQLLGLTYNEGTSFPDVPTDHVAYDAIQTMSAYKVLHGFSDGTFHPDELLTRAQMSKVIASAFNYTIKTDVEIPYTDVSKTFKPYVFALYTNGISSGVTPTNFASEREISLQEMAAFMDRAYKKVPGTSYSDFEVLNAVNEATRKARTIAIQGLEAHFPKQQANDIREDMSHVAMDPYLTQTITAYEVSCYYCDGASVQRDFEFGLPFEIVSKSNTLVKVDATVPSSVIQSGHRAIIELVHVGETWKIKSHTSRSFTTDPLQLTIEEATDYLSYAISKYWQEEVQTIKYVGKEPRFGLDLFLINGKTTYLFNVNTGELDHYIPN